EAARAADATVGVLVDLDVGLHRTGVQSPAEALQLAQLISKTSGLRLDGIMFYPGQLKHPPSELEQLLFPIAALLDETIDVWRRSSLQPKIVSGGSTPTAYHSHHLKALTEIRPGTYIFNDMSTVSRGYCGLADCAARLVCTVISTAVPGKFVIDGG